MTLAVAAAVAVAYLKSDNSWCVPAACASTSVLPLELGGIFISHRAQFVKRQECPVCVSKRKVAGGAGI